jgi:phosphate-selective porin OprO and OprP
MKSLITTLAFALLAGPAMAQESPDTAKRIADLEKKVAKLSAPKADKKDKDADDPNDTAGFSYKMDGRVFLDGTYFSGSNNSLGGGTSLRAIRLGWKLTMGPKWYGEAELEFSGGEIAMKDMYLEYTGWQNQSLKFGHVKAPIGHDTLMSNVNIWVMDRSFTDGWNFSRRVGVHYSTWGDSWGVKGAFFGQSLDDTNANIIAASDAGYKLIDNGGWGYAGRVAFLPFHQDDTHLIHLAAASGIRTMNAGAPRDYTFSVGPRPSVGKINGAKFLSATVSNVDKFQLSGLEFAGQFGPFSWLSEYQISNLKRRGTQTQIWDAVNLKLIPTTAAQQLASTQDHKFSTYYAQVSYVINGQKEYRGGNDFLFKGTTPRTTAGAWELVARYEDMNLDDITSLDAIKGGDEKILTLGLNYYARKNLRFMLNYHFVKNNDNAVTSKGYSPSFAKVLDPAFNVLGCRIAYNF